MIKYEIHEKDGYLAIADLPHNCIFNKVRTGCGGTTIALQTIPANEIAMAELQGCAEKEMCIMETLTAWMIELKRNQSEKKAA